LFLICENLINNENEFIWMISEDNISLIDLSQFQSILILILESQWKL
jgi:hypothetical protein